MCDSYGAECGMLRGDETSISRKRWLVLLVICFIAITVGFSTTFLGVINETLSIYFGWIPLSVDWLSLILAVGVVISAVPVGLCFIVKPLEVKAWLHVALLVQGTSFLTIAVALVVRKYPQLILAAQFFCGFTTAILLPLTSLATTTWFSENEQLAVYWTTWVAVRVGNLIGTGVATAVFRNTQAADEQNVTTFAYVYASVAATCFGVLHLVWLFIPELPTKPPTQFETQRRSSLYGQRRRSWKKSVRKLCKETKALSLNKYLIFVVLIYALLGGLINAEFLLTPTKTYLPQNVSSVNSSLDGSLNEQRSALLTVLAAGGVVGSIASVMLLLKLTTYHAAATITVGLNFLFSLAMLFSYLYSCITAMYIAIFFAGATFSGGIAFIGEILKHLVGADMSGTTRDLAVTFLMMVSEILFSTIGRTITGRSSGIYFFVYISLCSLIIEILSYCVYFAIGSVFRKKIVSNQTSYQSIN